MKKIQSFQVDHTRLQRGIYVSRKDHVQGSVITTLDIRMKEPNREAALTPEISHTIEHMGATFLRNHRQWGAKTIYFGPMGCLTGFYLLVNDDCSSRELLPSVMELFAWTANYTGNIPGSSPVECGNYRLMDLDGARTEAETFIKEVLSRVDERNLIYPA